MYIMKADFFVFALRKLLREFLHDQAGEAVTF